MDKPNRGFLSGGGEYVLVGLPTLWLFVGSGALRKDMRFHYFTGVDWAGIAGFNVMALLLALICVFVCKKWLRLWAVVVVLLLSGCVWLDYLWSVDHLGHR